MDKKFVIVMTIITGEKLYYSRNGWVSDKKRALIIHDKRRWYLLPSESWENFDSNHMESDEEEACFCED